MKDYNEKLIDCTTLANGIKVSLFDFCRLVAGDRWYVKIICRLELAVPEERLAATVLDGAGREAFQQRYNGILVHEFAKERNFVSEDVKDEVVKAIVGQLQANSLGYIANPAFADNLFEQKVEELARELHVRSQLTMDEEEGEDGGPADFSACFKD